MTDTEITPREWRRALGLKPFFSRNSVKRIITRLHEGIAHEQKHANRERDQRQSVRDHADAFGHNHLPNLDSLSVSLRFGNLRLDRGVSLDLFCKTCQRAWPCDTYRLARDVYQLCLRAGQELPAPIGRARVSVVFSDSTAPTAHPARKDS